MDRSASRAMSPVSHPSEISVCERAMQGQPLQVTRAVICSVIGKPIQSANDFSMEVDRCQCERWALWKAPPLSPQPSTLNPQWEARCGPAPQGVPGRSLDLWSLKGNSSLHSEVALGRAPSEPTSIPVDGPETGSSYVRWTGRGIGYSRNIPLDA